MLLRRLVVQFHEPRAAAVRENHDAAEELEAAVDVIGLAPVIGHEADAAVAHPVHGAGALLDYGFREIGIDVVLRNATEVVEILFRAVFAEVRARDFVVGQVGHDLFDVRRAVMNHAKAAAGIGAVAAALVLRRALEHENAGAAFACGQRRAHRGIAAAKHDYVIGW